jgi:hypothetical protein
VGVMLSLLWPIGLLPFFLYFLVKNKVSIVGDQSDPDPKKYSPRNQKYYAVQPFRPLFRFYKNDCYKFEVYFLIEKIILSWVVKFFQDRIAGMYVSWQCAHSTFASSSATIRPSACHTTR